MDLNKLPKIVTKSKRRLGRGHGSGRGKTAGRGTKGQKAREKVKISFEGGQTALIRRLPLKRGKARNKSLRPEPIIVNLKYLNFLAPETVVDLRTLIDAHIVEEDEAKNLGVKILGDGELKLPLIVKLPCSHKAEEKIKKAGGKVEVVV